MKALFVHDNKFRLGRNGRVYSDGQFPYAAWQRYLKFFDELVVVGRSLLLGDGESDSCRRLNVSSGPGVSFAFMPNIAHPGRLFRYGPMVSRMLKRHVQGADAVIVRTSLLGKIAAYWAGKTGKPWALEIVGCAWDALWNYGNIYGRLYAPLAYFNQNLVARKAPFAIYVTREFLQRRYPCPGKTAAVSNVDVTESPAEVLERRQRRIAEPGRPFVFGLIGSLSSKYKGIQTALEALGRLRGRLPPFELRVLGGGDAGPWKRLSAPQAWRIRFDKIMRLYPG